MANKFLKTDKNRTPLFRVETQSGMFEYFEANSLKEAEEQFKLFQEDEAGEAFKGEKIYETTRIYTRMFEVSEDLQGGDFGKGRILNAEDWRQTAWCWADSDCNEALVELVDNMRGEPDEVIIDTIAEIWSLEFKEVLPWKTR